MLATLGPDCIVDTTGRTNKRCHKHCLHSFNYTVKVRFDEFQATTKYQGPPPDVSFVLFCFVLFSFGHSGCALKFTLPPYRPTLSASSLLLTTSGSSSASFSRRRLAP